MPKLSITNFVRNKKANKAARAAKPLRALSAPAGGVMDTRHSGWRMAYNKLKSYLSKGCALRSSRTSARFQQYFFLS